MSNQKLNEALLKLKKALQGADLKDNESRESLKAIVALIEEKLKAPAKDKEHSQLLQALEERAVYFENSHPLISRTLEEIIDILTKMGM